MVVRAITWVLMVLQLLLLGSPGEMMEVPDGLCPGSPCKCQNMPKNKLKAICSHLSLNTVDSAKLPSNVVELFIDHNNITDVNSTDFANLQRLHLLDLSFNSIGQLDDHAFANLSKLNILNLENNFLDLSQLPAEVFSALIALEQLKLNNNSIENDYPERALSRLTSLKYLSIGGKLYLKFGPGFQSLTQLTTLVVSGTFGWCNISTLTTSSLANVPHVQVLDISFCDIETIERNAFLPLHNLQSLNITGNFRLGFKNFGIGMEGISPNFTKLIANYIVKAHTSCVVIQKEYIKNLENTSLTRLYLDDNSIVSLERGTLPLLPKSLEYISAQRNKFSYGLYLWDLHTMTGLKEVALSGQSYALQGPDHSDDEDHCSFSQCDGAYEDQDWEDVDWLSGMMQSRSHWFGESEDEVLNNFNATLPENLTRVHYNFTQLTFKIGELLIKAPKLEYLDLSSNLVQFQKGRLRGLENVTYIDLSNNLARKMSKKLFLQCEGLKHLNLSYNFFGWQIYKDRNGSIFQNLPNLETLVLTNNDLPGLTGAVISNLKSLKTLNISNNGLFNFSPVMNNLTQLLTVDASNNQIKWLTPWTMKELALVKEHSKNFTFILRRNPLVCDCENLDILQWLQSSNISPANMTGYYCLMTNRQPRFFNNSEEFKDVINELSHQCKNNFGLALGCFSIFIAAIGLMVGAILYRYRWKLRYLYYAARLRYLADNAPEEDESEFLFDAFVSYADEDRGFVINDMRARLEHESSMTLNIHHRDFMPGEPIVSNIVGAIKKSRKMLVLLSPNFLKSYWCKYELHMAQMESISTGRDIIIVIMYESVPARNIPPEFLHLLQSDSYIEYPRTESDVDVFWAHLNAALRRRTHRYGSQSSQAQSP